MLIQKLIQKWNPHTYDSEYEYKLGDKVVINNSEIYLSLKNDNIGNHPRRSPNWKRLI